MKMEINLELKTLLELYVALEKCLQADDRFDFLTIAEYSVLNALNAVFDSYIDNPKDMICSYIGT